MFFPITFANCKDHKVTKVKIKQSYNNASTRNVKIINFAYNVINNKVDLTEK